MEIWACELWWQESLNWNTIVPTEAPKALMYCEIYHESSINQTHHSNLSFIKDGPKRLKTARTKGIDHGLRIHVIYSVTFHFETLTHRDFGNFLNCPTPLTVYRFWTFLNVQRSSPFLNVSWPFRIFFDLKKVSNGQKRSWYVHENGQERWTVATQGLGT